MRRIPLVLLAALLSAEAIAQSVALFPVLAGAAPEEPGSDSAAYALALRSGVKRNLEAAGYAVAEVEEALSAEVPEPAEASSRARKAGAAWAAVCRLSLKAGRIAYRVAIYDAEDGALASGDGFSVFSGLAAIPLMDDATGRAVRKLSSYEAERRGIARRLVGYRILVSCPVEGAAVSIELPGSSDGVPAGRIKNGRLELPYYPFLQGSTLNISAAATGSARMRATITLGPEAPVVELKKKRLRFDLLAGTGTGRLMGAGAEARLYPGSEWFFVFLEDRIYAGYDFEEGSSPIIHDEFWNGLGWYLYFPPSSKFRMSYSIGYGILLSMVTAPGAEDRLFCDIALLPASISAEYDLRKDFAAWMSIRSSYSIGARGTGLLPVGWIGGGAPALSVGALWRRR